MVHYRSDSAEIERAMERLVSLVTSCGGEIDDSAILSCTGGHMSIVVPKNRGSPHLIKLPRACLLPEKDFSLVLNGDDLCLSAHSDKFSREQVSLLEIMLELYNQTEKIKDFKKRFSWLLLRNETELLRLVLEGRRFLSFKRILDQVADEAPHVTIKRYLDRAISERPDGYIIESFLKSRFLGFKAGPDRQAESVLMPVIDFLNHHYRARPFRHFDENGQRYIAVQPAQPVQDSQECFVSYGAYDCLDLFLAYHYVDEHVPFVRSIPMDLDFGRAGVVRHVGFPIIPRHKNLPPEIADIGFYLPTIQGGRQGLLEVSGLLVPGPTAPRALRRVLEALLGRLDPNPSVTDKEGIILTVENDVIINNLRYYRGFSREIEARAASCQDSSLIESLRKVVSIQFANLESYRGFCRF